MNSKRKGYLLLTVALLALVSLAPFLLHAGRNAHGQTLSVSIPDVQVNSKERVVGFEIHIASGRIAALPDIPIGWNVSIDNNPSWKTKIAASSTVGAAAVDAGFFRDFLIVEKHESPDLPFHVSGEIVVTEDFTTERHIEIAMKDFELKKTAAQSSGACK